MQVLVDEDDVELLGVVDHALAAVGGDHADGHALHRIGLALVGETASGDPLIGGQSPRGHVIGVHEDDVPTLLVAIVCLLSFVSQAHAQDCTGVTPALCDELASEVRISGLTQPLLAIWTLPMD